MFLQGLSSSITQRFGGASIGRALVGKVRVIGLLVFAIICYAAAVEAKPGLPRSTPEAEGVDSAGLQRFVTALEQRIDAVHSFMLVRHGKVVAEGWWSPYEASDPHVMYSVTKSFTSTAVGFASQEGLLSVNDTVLSFFPDRVPDKPAEKMKEMRIRDLLRMSTGHAKDPSPAVRESKDGAWVKTFLASEVEDKPGTHFLYNSAGSYVLGAVVQKVSGQTLEEFLRPRLFEPLGIDAPFWGKSPEGVNLGDGGISLRTEDLAKFGQFYLQRGVWNGERLLSEDWVDAATSLQTASGGNPDSNWDAGYGYQFWRNKRTGYRADGAFGQFSFVLPKYDAVLAVTSGTSDMAAVMDTVWEMLLPALRERPLPSHPPALDHLKTKLASLRLPTQAGSPSSPRSATVSGKSYRFPDNELGIRGASVDLSGDTPRIHFEDADGTHDIACGVGRWVRGRTAYQKRISNPYDTSEQGIAASCAWTDESTLTAKLCFHQTPFTLTQRFNFEGDKLSIDTEHNLRWGEKKRPRITGKATATRR
jgi:CubicO group peptidase (beta-lactamase class C family)